MNGLTVHCSFYIVTLYPKMDMHVWVLGIKGTGRKFIYPSAKQKLVGRDAVNSLSMPHTNTHTCTSTLARTLNDIMHSPGPYPELNPYLTFPLQPSVNPQQPFRTVKKYLHFPKISLHC